MRILMALTALVTCLALAGPVTAKQYRDTDGGLIEVTGSITPTDKNGKATGPKQELPDSAIATPEPTPTVSARTAAVTSGCATVTATIKKDSLLGARIWQFWHYANWCWTYPRVTSVTRWTDGKGSNGWSYDGVVSSTPATWFQWCCLEPHSGHRRQFRGGFHFPVWVAQQTAYPWIKVEPHGNGTAYVVSGT